jgi:hypothetical protein
MLIYHVSAQIYTDDRAFSDDMPRRQWCISLTVLEVEEHATMQPGIKTHVQDFKVNSARTPHFCEQRNHVHTRGRLRPRCGRPAYYSWRPGLLSCNRDCLVSPHLDNLRGLRYYLPWLFNDLLNRDVPATKTHRELRNVRKGRPSL